MMESDFLLTKRRQLSYFRGTLCWEDRKTDYHESMTVLFKPYPDIYWFLWSLIPLTISTIEFDFFPGVVYDLSSEKMDRTEEVSSLEERMRWTKHGIYL